MPNPAEGVEFLLVDDRGEEDLVAQAVTQLWHRGQPQEEPVGRGFVAVDDGVEHPLEAFLDRTVDERRPILEVAVEGLVALEHLLRALLLLARVVARETAFELRPHVEPLGHVVHGLREGQIALSLREPRLQPQAGADA